MLRKYTIQYGRDCSLRIKIMYFRDFYFDGEYAFGESDFFVIPRDINQLYKYIESLYAVGDIP